MNKENRAFFHYVGISRFLSFCHSLLPFLLLFYAKKFLSMQLKINENILHGIHSRIHVCKNAKLEQLWPYTLWLSPNTAYLWSGIFLYLHNITLLFPPPLLLILGQFLNVCPLEGCSKKEENPILIDFICPFSLFGVLEILQ